MRRHRLALFVALAPLALGCVKPDKKSPPDASASSFAVDAAALYRPTPVLISTWGKDAKLRGPESVIHDEVADKYLVSNVEGKPLDADKKAFISRLDPEAIGLELKWIESGKNKVVLNAPKGMAIVATTLWVADIDTVRLFDRRTGAPMADIPIPGATYLNDIVVGKDGDILVSDSGLTAGASGLEPSGTDAVYSIGSDRTVKTIAKGDDLKNPHGLLVYKDKVWVVSQTGNELASLNSTGKRWLPQQLSRGKLDGITAIPSGDVFISSWDAKMILRGRPGEAFNASIEGLRSPAGLGYDAKRNRLLVPSFEDDELRSYEIK